MLVLTYLRDRVPWVANSSIEVTNQAHSFLALVVSFLLVSRVNIALNRYNVARDCLGSMYRESRELIQSACVLTHDKQDSSSKQWRFELAYRTLMLLRTTMAVLSYRSNKIPAWDVPELNGDEYDDIRNTILIDDDNRYAKTSQYKTSTIQGTWQETMRVPIRMAYLTRKTIHSQEKRLEQPLVFSAENRLFGNVDSFMNGYYGIRKYLTTPVPFPLIQMSRTFMFLFVFTVPFVLLSDKSNAVAHCFAVFLLTYGFVGLETVAIELDDPFGDDENDFDAM